jgi:hypothetical protein
MKRNIAALLLGAGALAGAGCGGSDSVSAEAAGLTVTAPSSEMDFGRRVDAVCRQVVVAADRARTTATTAAGLAEHVDKLLAYQGAAIEVLRELDAPDDAQDDLDQLVAAIEDQRELTRRSLTLLEEADGDLGSVGQADAREIEQQTKAVGARLERATRALGAPTCAFGATG